MRRVVKRVVTLVTVLLLVLIVACAPAPQGVTPAPAPTPAPEEVTPAPTPTPEPTPTPAPTPTPILPAGMGMLQVRVTDPPHPPFGSIVVSIDSINVHKVVPGEPEWLGVSLVVTSFDLVTLIGVSDTLGAVETEAGSFSQIRIGVTGVVVDGVPAIVHSDTLRIVRPFNVREGMITVLELDFDGEKSVITTGREEFIFKPVVHLKVEHSNSSANGGDTTPPVITIIGVEESQVIISPDTVTPEFTVSDDADDPVPTVIATLNGVTFTSGTVEVSDPGEYELMVTAIDTSGNEAEVAINFKIVEVEDTTPPVITIIGVEEGQVIISPATVTPEFSVSDDTDDPVPTVIATLNGVTFTSGTVEVSDPGEYELVVTAIDTSGNEAEVAVNFKIVEE